MVLNAGSLNRRIQFRREVTTPDGHGGFNHIWSDLGAPIFARRRDVSDAERRVAGGGWDNRLVTRFVVRASPFVRTIRRTDRIAHEGEIFEIDGLKEVPDSRGFIEITSWTEDIA